jgi:hypothetical protein
VLLDRQQQLEREKAERQQRKPVECPRCAEPEQPTPWDDPEQAAEIIIELAKLGPDAVRAALGVPNRPSDELVSEELSEAADERAGRRGTARGEAGAVLRGE